MAGEDLDCLVVADPANMNYLTGYDGWSFYTPQCVVVPADGDMLLATRQMDANGARLTTFLDDDAILGFPDDYVQQRDRHPMDWIAEQLRSRGLLQGRVGVEKDAYFFSVRAYEALKAGAEGAELVDSHEAVNWVRSIKSPAELQLMRTAAQIVQSAMTVAYETIRPGVRQCDAAAAIQAAQARGTDEAGGDYPAIVPMLPTGPGTSTPHLTWSDAPFRDGEPTILELAGARRRYHCPMSRTLMLGQPSKRLADTAKITIEGLETALATVRPGVTCEQVEAAWREHIARHGLEKTSRIGYSVGLAYPPDWGEHTMSLRPGDTTPLAPNMTFHMIVGMWMDDWGFEASETFVVTDGGAECLCSFPRELRVIA